uniref:Putative ubiquitin-associated domain-containing protein 2 n=1 Tax=Ornithodoros turicata TaxID=34597 RepID=A0A2R5LLF5_9ACAR
MTAILSQFSTTGFYKAPVSKGILGCMFFTTCALNTPMLAHMKHLVVYDISDIVQGREFWRLVTSKVSFLDTKDLVCGSLLIYYFRIFERRYGSHKFASFLLAASTVATLLELASIYTLRDMDVHLSPFPSGPYALVFSLFVSYFLDIPRVAQSYILGVPVTGKTLTYLLGLQVMSTSRETAICGLCSLVAGALCRWNFLYVQRWLCIPNWLAKLSDMTLGRLLSSSPPKEGPLQMGATLEIQRQQQAELLEMQLLQTRNGSSAGLSFGLARQNMAQGYSERLIPNLDGPGTWDNIINTENHANTQAPQPEVQVQTLVDMGFDRQKVVRALRNSNNDVNLATTLLLSES